MKQKLTKHLSTALSVVVALWVLMGSFPTSWIYDLWAGTGPNQGQKADEQAAVLTRREQIEDLFYQDAVVTASGSAFVRCPLMGARDPDLAGEHRGRGGRRWSIPQYFFLMAFPAPVRVVLQNFLLNGFYNSYYLLELEDGSYVCVFFDDYVLLARPFQEELPLPAGRVRYAGTEEKTMLHHMAEEYDVEVAYIVDMYNYEKAHWMADFALRLVALFVVFLIGATIQEQVQRLIKKRQELYN